MWLFITEKKRKKENVLSVGLGRGVGGGGGGRGGGGGGGRERIKKNKIKPLTQKCHPCPEFVSKLHWQQTLCGTGGYTHLLLSSET